MATNFNYSNNMTGVNAKIAEVTTEEFRKRYVFVTNSGIYYVYGDKRYKTENEARNALIKMGYNNGDIKIVQQWGGYNYITEAEFDECIRKLKDLNFVSNIRLPANELEERLTIRKKEEIKTNFKVAI